MGKDIPIIFSGPMVRALLEGRKTMTRRLAWQKPRIAIQVGAGPIEPIMVSTPWQRVKVGDRIWVRENLTRSGGYIHYAADQTAIGWEIDRAGSKGRTWPTTWKQDPRPSIHMPRVASRLTLIVTGVKVERLDGITKEDALAEGCKVVREHCYVFEGTGYDRAGLCHSSPVTAYSILWDDLHGDGAWEQNPEVVAISFRVIKANIDAPEARLAA